MASTFTTTGPANGEMLKEFPAAADHEIADAIAASHAAFQTWRTTPVEKRTEPIRRAADLMEERIDELSRLLTLEMGKLTAEARAEVELCAKILRYYADEGPGHLADERRTPDSGGTGVVKKEPKGPLIGVMPWNFPYYQVVRLAAPNLIAGNTILLKHAPNCPQSAVAFAALMSDAGLPDDCYINLFADTDQIQTIIADERVAGASLTGSEAAGSAVAAGAGENLTKVILELGGSDPFIVLDSDDLDETVSTAVAGRMANAGQSCIASKRLIVVEDHYEEFVEKFTTAMAGFTPGDPADPDTTLAPLSSEQAAADLMEQVHDAVEQGATVQIGGGRVDRPGAYVQPTVLTGVIPSMRAYSEELFGPVAVIYRVADEEEAIHLANDSSFGLGGSVMSADPARARRVADRIDSAMVWINAATWTEPDLPFGGTKRSGIGRELGAEGILEFVNKKLIREP
ncbi:NAD-dependent succinate-semialdehyde dehydrogenase [Brevibacterium jeotgali]|uniref:Succinate-semialdehyde dehydrogenase / glutarate-semialdehyde dehydrogenase n=1 Tax=Brevibacterium jeotgali TaxID=1262550 RepID=A0A2H1L594_9MICO|nr:NAD-dependent succinate-semialdehyde dehydrogenase [Brevibacterium jeotgali]TWB98483.1 succinate-semialdehyde dehydrogenase/glutarate-semialdehyde dehydrogenase [Brevibacterium jeotgali]SMY12066.1 succinate-semialdehyde dehydrogenase / glutarate-semialdehyde dehydrogenase [Brevibacterium jeotgali]